MYFARWRRVVKGGGGVFFCKGFDGVADSKNWRIEGVEINGDRVGGSVGREGGRKFLFNHGGNNIGEKYTSRLLAKRVLGHAPPRNFFKCCNLVRSGAHLDQILSLIFF